MCHRSKNIDSDVVEHGVHSHMRLWNQLNMFPHVYVSHMAFMSATRVHFQAEIINRTD